MLDTGFVADPAARASLERKLQLVRDRVAAVVHGYAHGMYIFGSGGLGKSFTVIQHLDALQANYTLFNSRMTAKGLFRALQQAPDAIHVLEDMERLVMDRDAQGVLRSALWAQPGKERVVTWTTGSADGKEQFSFRGGIIVLANRPLADLPELEALATRIILLRLEVTDAELRAQMCDLASQGFQRGGKPALEPLKCREVAAYLIQECRAAGCPLDLRLLHSSYEDYLQWEGDHASCHWQDLVTSRVRETAHHFRHEVTTLPREERKRLRRVIVREILQQTADPDEQLRLYRDRTGMSRADFFRRKGEVQSGEFEGNEN